MGLFYTAAVALPAGYHPPKPPPAEYAFVPDTGPFRLRNANSFHLRANTPTRAACPDPLTGPISA
jgi:hypothetical protein